MKRKVALIFGGDSAEREVSIVTAGQIADMKPDDVELFFVLVLENREMVLTASADAHKCVSMPLDKKFAKPVVFACGSLFEVKAKKLVLIDKIDAAIVCCHGGFGEDGRLVSVIEAAGVPCSAGNHAALAVAMDKVLSKAVFLHANIPVVESFWFLKSMWDDDRDAIFNEAKEIGYPVVVKPARQGSSVGISFVRTDEQFEDAVELALEFDDKILVEKGLEHFRELNVSVVCDGDANVLVSEIEEPIKSGDFLSFEDKYMMGKKGAKSATKNCTFGAKSGSKFCGMQTQKRRFPADIDAKTCEKVQFLAQKAVLILGLLGVSRLDFLLCDETLFLNEINAVPGSLACYFWKDKYCGSKFFDMIVGIAKNKKRLDKKTPIAKFLK